MDGRKDGPSAKVIVIDNQTFLKDEGRKMKEER